MASYIKWWPQFPTNLDLGRGNLIVERGSQFWTAAAAKIEMVNNFDSFSHRPIWCLYLFVVVHNSSFKTHLHNYPKSTATLCQLPIDGQRAFFPLCGEQEGRTLQLIPAAKSSIKWIEQCSGPNSWLFDYGCKLFPQWNFVSINRDFYLPNKYKGPRV